MLQNKLFKKYLFNDIRFNTKFRRGEDEQIICYLLKKVNKYVITDERLYYYYNRPESAVHMGLTENESIEENLNILTMYEERLSLFNENKFSDIYFASFINMLNLNITAFFSIHDKKVKRYLYLRYRYFFKEKFNKKIARNVSKKLIKYGLLLLEFSLGYISGYFLLREENY